MIATWVMAIFVFSVWALWVVACAVQVGRQNVEAGVPDEQRRGTSWLPGFPIFPIVFTGLGWALDRWLLPRSGSVLVGGFHAVFAVVLVIGICRDVLKVRAFTRRR